MMEPTSLSCWVLAVLELSGSSARMGTSYSTQNLLPRPCKNVPSSVLDILIALRLCMVR